MVMVQGLPGKRLWEMSISCLDQTTIIHKLSATVKAWSDGMKLIQKLWPVSTSRVALVVRQVRGQDPILCPVPQWHWNLGVPVQSQGT